MKLFTKFVVALAALVVLASPAAAQNFSSITVLNGSCGAPAFTFRNDTTTGFYLKSTGVIGLCAGGVEIGTISSSGVATTSSGAKVQVDQTFGSVSITTGSFSDSGSKQGVSSDLTVSGTPGHEGGYIAATMGNLLGASITGSGNSNFAGGITKYSLTGANSSTYAKSGHIAEVGDGSTSADGAYVAVLGGDAATTSARAAFTVDRQNSTVASTFTYGVDLQGPGAHNGYQAMSYGNADIRLTNNVVLFSGSGAPVNGASGTGVNFAGPGSLYVDRSNGKWYTNTNTIGSPTWTVVGTQS